MDDIKLLALLHLAEAFAAGDISRDQYMSAIAKLHEQKGSDRNIKKAYRSAQRKAITAGMSSIDAAMGGSLVEPSVYGPVIPSLRNRPARRPFPKVKVHPYGCALFRLGEDTDRVRSADPCPILDSLTDSIDAADLCDDGRERDHHITVLNGFDKLINSEQVRSAIRHMGPVEVTLGGLSTFSNPEYDVLKVDVRGKGLHELRDELKQLPHFDEYPEFKPHITIARLKPGKGRKYKGLSGVEGIRLRLRKLIYSTPEGDKSAIVLNAGPAVKKKRLADY
jgi:hypothetical protein